MAPKVHSVTLWLHTRLEPVPHFSRSWRHFFGILETLFWDFGDTFFGFWRHLLGILEITLGNFRGCCTPCHAVHWLMYRCTPCRWSPFVDVRMHALARSPLTDALMHAMSRSPFADARMQALASTGVGTPPGCQKNEKKMIPR